MKLADGILSATVALAIVGCTSIDDTRLPAAPVNINFTSQGMWEAYGVRGALDYRRFVKSERVPADFPYTAASYTGFGGVILVGDFYGTPRAFDLSCPVECKANVRIVVTERNVAECPECHSTYEVFGDGHPLSGIAHERGYGLTQYSVFQTAGGGWQIKH